MEDKEVKTTEEKVIEPKTETVETPVVPVAHVETKSGWMPKRTFLLIALLVIVTACLLALALLQNVKPQPVAKPTATLNYAQTNLSLSTPVAATPSGYTTNVQISTKNKVTATQLEIAYDPKVLTNVDVKPGTFFTTPTILLKKVDLINGRITYVLGIGLGQTAVTGNGTVATVSFTRLATTAATKSPINFEPKTAVTAVGYAQSVLKQTTGVLFSPAK